jgi:hypothetical protein
LGGTGYYIDGIRAKDVTHPIMIGSDRFNRPFITFRTTRCNETASDITVEVLFQRYSNTQYVWTCGCCGNRGFIHDCSHCMTGGFRHQFIKQNIYNLLNNVGYIKRHNSSYNEDEELCIIKVPRVLV